MLSHEVVELGEASILSVRGLTVWEVDRGCALRSPGYAAIPGADSSAL